MKSALISHPLKPCEWYDNLEKPGMCATERCR